MDRIEIIRDLAKTTGLGLELGPSINPIFPKSSGFNFRTLDWASKEVLIQNYRAHQVDTSKIEELDYVSDGKRLVDVVGQSEKFDVIVASHVFEHFVDLIESLQDSSFLLKQNGKLVVACPDKRYCFDRLRQTSNISSVINAHLLKTKKTHSIGTAVDYLLNVCSNNGRFVWAYPEVGEFPNLQFIHGLDDAINALSIKDDQYRDYHAWVFTPASFELLISDLYRLRLIDLSISYISESVGCEFFVVLEKSQAVLSTDRISLLERMELGG
jgi:predicted SAM-dependent methyltransferase